MAERDREVVIGDLAEEHALRTRSAPPGSVSQWYWGQVCRSIPRLLWSSCRNGFALRTSGVALAVYLAAGLLEFGATKAMSRLLGPDARPLPVLRAIVGLATIMLGGYLAARIRPAAATALAGIVMIAVVILMVTMSDSAPLWYGLAFLIVGPLAALAGGTLCRGRRTGGAGRAV